NHLHVPLRHRLLREAHGFEGFGAVSEGPHRHDFAALDLVEVCAGILQLDPTGTAPSVPVSGDQDSVAEIAQLLVVNLEELPIRGEVLDPPPSLIVSSVDTALQHSQYRYPLHVRIKQREKR